MRNFDATDASHPEVCFEVGVRLHLQLSGSIRAAAAGPQQRLCGGVIGRDAVP